MSIKSYLYGKAANWGLRGLARQKMAAGVKGKATESMTDLTGGWEVLGGFTKTITDGTWESYAASEFEDIYREKNSVVYSCVRKLITSAQEAEIHVVKTVGRGTKKKIVPVEDHWATNLLYRPNETMSFEDFLAYFILNIMLTGDTFAWKLRNKGQEIRELWPTPSSWIERVTNQNSELTGYKMWVGDNKPKKAVSLQDMMVGYFPDPTSLSIGLSPLKAATRDDQADRKRGNYLGEMLTNIHTPGMILKQEHGWSPEEKADARALLYDLVGPGKRGSPLFMEGKESEAAFPTPLSDLDWPGVAGLSETRLCAAYGVPPIVIGLRSGLEHATYSNFEEANQAFYKHTMKPLWKFLAAVLTRGLIYAEDGYGEEYIDFDLTRVAQLEEDLDKRGERSTKLFNGGLITRNEGREMVDLEALPPELGDVVRVPAQMLEVPVDETLRKALEDAARKLPENAIGWDEGDKGGGGGGNGDDKNDKKGEGADDKKGSGEEGDKKVDETKA